MDNISFQSKIRIISRREFSRKLDVPKTNIVKYPWTKKESVLAPTAATMDIYDCTAVGINDGYNVFLLHICPTNDKNRNFKSIERFIKERINLDSPDLQGFVLGSKSNNINSPDSTKLFDNFVNLLKQHNIPTSYFKGGDYENHIWYSCPKDEWVIGAEILDNIEKKALGSPQNACKRIFEKFELSQKDELTW